MTTKEPEEKYFEIFKESDDFLYIKVIKGSTTEKESTVIAKLMEEQVLLEYQSNKNISFSILLDITKKGKSPNLSEEAKQMYRKMSKHPQTKKVAVLGKTSFHTFIIKLILTMSQSKVKWFTKDIDARIWLSEV